MTQTTASATDFTPTSEMRARHLEWVDTAIVHVWQGWSDAGEVAADPAGAQAALEHVRAELMVTGREEWMHPLHAFGVLTGPEPADDPDTNQERRSDYADALRTSAGIGDDERARWVARALGVSVATAKKYGPNPRTRAATKNGPAALYRHYDEHSILLYIGITNDPDMRVALHAYTAEWLHYSARCDVEWHDTRPAALAAERAAIRDERPLFNRQGSIVDPENAEEYLMMRDPDRIAEMLT